MKYFSKENNLLDFNTIFATTYFFISKTKAITGMLDKINI